MIDTNLVLSALVFGGTQTGRLRQLWQGGALAPLVSRETTAELIRALTYPKFKLTAAEQRELLADYLPYCETVVVPNPAPQTPDCRDLDDVPFLQLALAGRADALVTGDQDLLTLGDQPSCRILRLDTLLAAITR